jgi:hypothetical protein
LLIPPLLLNPRASGVQTKQWALGRGSGRAEAIAGVATGAARVRRGSPREAVSLLPSLPPSLTLEPSGMYRNPAAVGLRLGAEVDLVLVVTLVRLGVT